MFRQVEGEAKIVSTGFLPSLKPYRPACSARRQLLRGRRWKALPGVPCLARRERSDRSARHGGVNLGRSTGGDRQVGRPPGEVDFGGRLSREGQVRPPVIVMVQPRTDHPTGVVATAQFLQVNRLVLQRPPESLDERLSIHRPLPSMLIRTPASSSGRVKASLVNWLPWSVFEINGAPYRRNASGRRSRRIPWCCQLPRQHEAAGPVHDGDQVEETAPHRNVGDVGRKSPRQGGFPPDPSANRGKSCAPAAVWWCAGRGGATPPRPSGSAPSRAPPRRRWNMTRRLP